jgi:hypothetical protein
MSYESASQFSRMFGAPPKRDVTELKALPAAPVIA